MVDDFDCDAPGKGFGERARSVAVERGPGVFVDLGLEGGLEGAVGIIRTEEIGLPNKKALTVVVGVDEPAGDAIRTVAADLDGVGMEDKSTPLTFTRIWPSSSSFQ